MRNADWLLIMRNIAWLLLKICGQWQPQVEYELLYRLIVLGDKEYKPFCTAMLLRLCAYETVLVL